MAPVSHLLPRGAVWLPLVLDDLTLVRLLNLARLVGFLTERPFRCHVHATTPQTINTS